MGDTSDATATAADIFFSKTAYVNGGKVVGTMPNRASWSDVIDNVSDTITVPAGCHSGNGTVTLAPVDRARLIPSNIKSGVSILGVTGTYSGASDSLQQKAVTPSRSAQTIVADSNYDGLSQVAVAAIPSSITSNTAGGLTLTIG